MQARQAAGLVEGAGGRNERLVLLRDAARQGPDATKRPVGVSGRSAASHISEREAVGLRSATGIGRMIFWVLQDAGCRAPPAMLSPRTLIHTSSKSTTDILKINCDHGGSTAARSATRDATR
jgi:hypothetical protein